jgi:phospholipid/cholesterol/gamma-HCH transport system substrate-binding protein
MRIGTRPRWIALGVVVALVVGALWWQARPKRAVHVTAHFSRAIGLYAGSDVRILGVKVGTLTKVTPEGPSVRVDFEYDPKYRVPAGAEAVIVPPSLVSDRYLQLTWDRTDPANRTGPTMADGADLPLSRTAAPLELDDLYKTVNDLSVALGPSGANKDGALNRVLEVGAANLRGNGKSLNQTLADLADAVRTLSENRGNLFGTVTNLQKFATALATSDQQVRLFTENLSTVSTQLAGEREELAAALSNLGGALGAVATFVKDNRTLLKQNVSGLADVTSVLVKERAALAEFLDLAPTTLANLAHAYNGRGGTLDTRMNLQFLQDPTFLCSVLVTAGIKNNQLCTTLSRAIGALPAVPGLDAPGDPNAIPTLPGIPDLPSTLPTLPALPSIPTLPGVRLPPILGGGS